MLIWSVVSFAQSDLENALKMGELLFSGLSVVKSAKPQTDAKNVESVCVKNKLLEKITFRFTGKDEAGKEIKKEMVVQRDGKECIYDVFKGIWTYEIVLSNNTVYKKGEYRLDDEITITVKQ